MRSKLEKPRRPEFQTSLFSAL